MYAATKWCVFGPPAEPVTSEWVLGAVQERCRRLGGRVELLQFHWYDVSISSRRILQFSMKRKLTMAGWETASMRRKSISTFSSTLSI